MYICMYIMSTNIDVKKLICKYEYMRVDGGPAARTRGLDSSPATVHAYEHMRVEEASLRLDSRPSPSLGLRQRSGRPLPRPLPSTL
jgi:hypothetical protein